MWVINKIIAEEIWGSSVRVKGKLSRRKIYKAKRNKEHSPKHQPPQHERPQQTFIFDWKSGTTVMFDLTNGHNLKSITKNINLDYVPSLIHINKKGIS